MKKQFEKLNYVLKLKIVKNLKHQAKNELKIININLDFDNPFIIKKKDASIYVKKCLNLAHKLSFNKKVQD